MSENNCFTELMFISQRSQLFGKRELSMLVTGNFTFEVLLYMKIEVFCGLHLPPMREYFKKKEKLEKIKVFFLKNLQIRSLEIFILN